MRVDRRTFLKIAGAGSASLVLAEEPFAGYDVLAVLGVPGMRQINTDGLAFYLMRKTEIPLIVQQDVLTLS